jgi:hypothetical protein
MCRVDVALNDFWLRVLSQPGLVCRDSPLVVDAQLFVVRLSQLPADDKQEALVELERRRQLSAVA